jgi:hypothetical protein
MACLDVIKVYIFSVIWWYKTNISYNRKCNPLTGPYNHPLTMQVLSGGVTIGPTIVLFITF